MRFRPVYTLAVFIPAAIVLDFVVGASPPFIFATAALGVVPAAALMGRATEELAARQGPGIGGLLNVAFGNLPELLIAFFALLEGLQEVVKASLVGSILGNILLVLGAAMLVGGLSRDPSTGARRAKQTFNRTAANAQSGMLMLALAALVLPALFQLIHGGGLPGVGEQRVDFGRELELLSLGVAVVLIASYVLGLVFSLGTHSGLFNPHLPEESGAATPGGAEPASSEGSAEPGEEEHWSVRRALGMLALSAVVVGVMSEILAGSIADTAEQIGLSEFFIGVVVAIVGNAAEHWVAVLVAAKNKMDLAVNIAVGSSAQIALFVAPLLVLLSFVFGPSPMALVFNGYEIAAMAFAVLIASFLTQEGESNWFEGAQLLALYAVLGLVFFLA